MVSAGSKRRTKPKKSVPPSRVRYEDANPAVTVRLSRELRDQLAELKEEHGLSLGDVLRIGLERAKPDLDAARDRGMVEGYDIARDEYEVTYWCSWCGRRHLSIASEEEKEAAARMMLEAGWHSPACR
jgi:hypothetical protein